MHFLSGLLAFWKSCPSLIKWICFEKRMSVLTEALHPSNLSVKFCTVPCSASRRGYFLLFRQCTKLSTHSEVIWRDYFGYDLFALFLAFHSLPTGYVRQSFCYGFFLKMLRVGPKFGRENDDSTVCCRVSESASGNTALETPRWFMSLVAIHAYA